MKRPLYKSCTDSSTRLQPGGHAGLWFDKFCHTWVESRAKNQPNPWSLKVDGDRNPKLDWIRTVVNRRLGDPTALEQYAARIAGLAHALGGQILVFKTSSRLATGLGREHPVENGFTWHPTLGTPYLPGSSVKGLVRAWVETGLAPEPPTPESFRRIFGSPPRTEQSRFAPNACGSVIFFDAVPVKPVALKPDVMTVHHADYYQGVRHDRLGIAPPADWDDPEPIPFLTVAPGALFLFALAPRDRSPEAAADCQTATTWLQPALERLGIGAKTAVGYGRMTRVDAEETRLSQESEQTRRQIEIQTRLAQLDPVARELEQEILAKRWEENKDPFVQPGVPERWIERLEKEPSPRAVERLKQLFSKHFPGLLENPDCTKGKKGKYEYKERWRNLAKRLNRISPGPPHGS